jgi:hypothetical protein
MPFPLHDPGLISYTRWPRSPKNGLKNWIIELDPCNFNRHPPAIRSPGIERFPKKGDMGYQVRVADLMVN